MKDKLDEMHELLVELKIEQVEIRKDLNYHIKRTDLLEDMVVRDLKPIKRHVDGVQWALNALKYLAGLSGLVAILAWLKTLL